MSTIPVKIQKQIRVAVLQALKDRAYRPIELIQELQSARITEAALKDVLAELIDRSIIELSPDRHITLRPVHSNEPLAAAR